VLQGSANYLKYRAKVMKWSKASIAATTTTVTNASSLFMQKEFLDLITTTVA
jgi:hypothetical protein